MYFYATIISSSKSQFNSENKNTNSVRIKWVTICTILYQTADRNMNKKSWLKDGKLTKTKHTRRYKVKRGGNSAVRVMKDELQEEPAPSRQACLAMSTGAAFRLGNSAVLRDQGWALQPGSRQIYLSQQSTGLQVPSGSS